MDKRKEQKILNEYYKKAIKRANKRDRTIKRLSIIIIVLCLICIALILAKIGLF